jgi:hypothetical protein
MIMRPLRAVTSIALLAIPYSTGARSQDLSKIKIEQAVINKAADIYRFPAYDVAAVIRNDGETTFSGVTVRCAIYAKTLLIGSAPITMGFLPPGGRTSDSTIFFPPASTVPDKIDCAVTGVFD